MHKNHKDPQELDLTKPRLAWYKQKKWRRHQDTVYWVVLQLAQRKGLKFYQTRSKATRRYTCHLDLWTVHFTRHFSHAVNTHKLLHITLHGSRMCCASRHLHGHPCRAPECCPFFDSLFLTSFLCVCFSYPFFFYLDTDLYLFLHVDVIEAISHWHSAK